MIKLRILLFCILFTSFSFAQEFSLQSPDGKIEVLIDTDNILKYAIRLDTIGILDWSPINLQLNEKIHTGIDAKVKTHKLSSVSNTLHPVVPRKKSVVDESYNQLEIVFKKGYSLIFRAYDEGVAYRWITDFKDSIQVTNETVSFNFHNDYQIWFPREESMHSHQERIYEYLKLSEVSSQMFCSTPTLVELNDGVKVFISESDLLDYPGMFLEGSESNLFGLTGKFAPFPLQTEQDNDRNVRVTSYAPFLAKSVGKRSFPWRVMIISENDKKLLESDLIWKLATPSKIEDPSWIKPGKVAWDWWNDNNIYGVDFSSGINTETYKYYINFAHDFGLEYVILDEGWYHLDDVLKVKKDINMPELLTYAKEKNVGIILWVTWKAFYDQMDMALDQFADWGVKGIKVDFMQRDDQWMVNYYTEVAKKAADHKLLVDFHGAYKPTGLHRTYPNVITFEGVAGLEQSKWGTKANPEHDLIIPFIRMVAGPMDYTPGAMINATEEGFRPVWSTPMSMGTRCHQLAMYIIYESPLQMLCDNPSNYKKETKTMEFLSQVPAAWDDTRVLDAKIADFVVMARKKGNKWFVGGMTDWEERDLTLIFEFLDSGEYTIKIWYDGVNANKHASDFIIKEININSKTILPLHLAKGGGFVGIIELASNKD